MSKQKLIEEVFGEDCNLYQDALFVNQDASLKEIENAYLKQWHHSRKQLSPDMSADEQIAVQKRLEALLITYRILSNPELRAKYDDMLAELSFCGESNSSRSLSEERQNSPQLQSANDVTINGVHVNHSFEQETVIEERNFNQMKTGQTSPKYSPRSIKDVVLGRHQKSLKHIEPDRQQRMSTDGVSDAQEMLAVASDEGSANGAFDNECSDARRFYRGKNGRRKNDFYISPSNSTESGRQNAQTETITIPKMIPKDPVGRKNLNGPITPNYSLRKRNASNNDDLFLKDEDKNSLEENTDVDEATDEEDNESYETSEMDQNTDDDKDIQAEKAATKKSVRFKGIVNEAELMSNDDDMTIGSETLGSLGSLGSIGSKDMYVVREEDITESQCLSTIATCLPENQQRSFNRIMSKMKAEIKGSLDDTVNAVDQVFNAFTIQPDEFSDLVQKIEVEKKTLQFSTKFIELAQEEKKKRLRNKKFKSVKLNERIDNIR